MIFWSSHPILTGIGTLVSAKYFFIYLILLPFIIFIQFFGSIFHKIFDGNNNKFTNKELSEKAEIDAVKLPNGGYTTIQERNASSIPRFYSALSKNIEYEPFISEKINFTSWFTHKVIALALLIGGGYIAINLVHDNASIFIFLGSIVGAYVYHQSTPYENQAQYESKVYRLYLDYFSAKNELNIALAERERINAERLAEDKRIEALMELPRRERAHQKGFDEFGFRVNYSSRYEKHQYHAKRKRAKERDVERKKYDKHRASERRMFTEIQRREVYERDQGICQICGIKILWNEYECDHIRPWSKGGRTEVKNAQCTCRPCNRTKSSKHE